jgi:5-hydroxyisourate hydrolase
VSISTHVLDTMRGTPAAGLAVALHRREPDGDWKEVAQTETDSDGRVHNLSEDELEAAEYRLEFDTRPYFERSGLNAFYPSVIVVFNFEGGHLHVPLLLSAYGYTTYKGT